MPDSHASEFRFEKLLKGGQEERKTERGKTRKEMMK